MYDDRTDLNRRLAELARDIEAGVVLSPATAVRARGDRRRFAASAALAGATTLAVTGAVVVTGIGLSDRPAGGVSTGAPLTAIPVTTTTHGSQAPDSTTSPPGGTTGPPASPRRPRSGDPTTIPARLRMHHEGETGWRRSDDPSAPGAINPCGGVDVTLAGRTAARTLTGSGLAQEELHSPSRVTHQLLLYSDDAAAAAAFSELAAAARSCGWLNAIPAMQPALADRKLGLRKWDPGRYSEVKDRYWLHDAVVVRDGNALFVLAGDTKGAGMTSYMADQELGYVLAPLCAAAIVCL